MISEYESKRLLSIPTEIDQLLAEFKQICRLKMNADQYQRFKYRTLAHIEPAVMEGSDWVTYDIDTLESVAETLVEEYEDGNED